MNQIQFKFDRKQNHDFIKNYQYLSHAYFTIINDHNFSNLYNLSNISISPLFSINEKK